MNQECRIIVIGGVRSLIVALARKAFEKRLEERILMIDEKYDVEEKTIEPVHPAMRKNKCNAHVLKSQVTMNKPARIQARTNC